MARNGLPGNPVQAYVESAFARLESPRTRARRLPLTPWTSTTPWGRKRLSAHLAERYDLGLKRVGEIVPGVFRVELESGVDWVARVMPPARPLDQAAGDAAILQFLERRGYSSDLVAAQVRKAFRSKTPRR